MAVDGNDRIEKSSFKLSPANARVSSTSTKSKKPAQTQTSKSKKTNPPSPRKRLFNSHQGSVSNVSDLRLHKKGRPNKGTKDEGCIIVDSDSDNENPRSLDDSDEQKTTRKQSFVTPSPHPNRRQSQQPNTAPLYNSSRSNSQQGKNSSGRSTSSPHFASNTRGKSRTVRNQSSSWYQQKKQQKTTQSTAFHSPKENPFSSYSFDPNSIEKSLDSQAVRSKEPSIFPSNVATSSFTSTKPRNSRTFRTPANRHKSSASSRISAHDLLKGKANELNQNHMVSTRNYANHDGATQRHYPDPFHQQPLPSGNRFTGGYAFGNHDPDHFSVQQQQFMQDRFDQFSVQQQHFSQPQRFSQSYPQMSDFQPGFNEGTFDQRVQFGLPSQYEAPQQFQMQMQRPPTSTGSVMTSNRFMNVRPQQFVQRQQQYFIQPPTYHESYDQGFAISGQSVGSIGGLSENRYMNMTPPQRMDPQFSQPHQSQHNYYEAAGDGMVNDDQGYNRGIPATNPYLRGNVVNPYMKQHNQDGSQSGAPPMREVVVQNGVGESSQFDEAFF